jgi:hypothetical protein
MFVTVMKAYGFVNNRHTIARVNKPDWEDIEVAIRRMNGKAYTSVNVAKSIDTERDEIFTLTVGGGKDGMYTVAANFESKYIIHNLVEPNGSETDTVRLPIGIDTFDVPKREIVSLDAALQAAKTYAEFGELDTKLTWDKVLVM